MIPFYSSCKAQNRYKAATVHGKNSIYKVQRFSSNTGNFALHNTGNKYSNTRMITNSGYQGKLYYTDMIGTEIDKHLLYDILRNVAGGNNINKMAKNTQNILTIFITFSTTGNVLDVSFLTDENTLITPEMFEQIETQIKEKIHAKFNERPDPNFGNKAPYSTYNIIKYSIDIRYSDMIIN